MTNHNPLILRIIKARPDFASAINQYEIADECMLRSSEHMSGRAVRKIIEGLIEDGYPIISTPHSPGGYCWGSKDGEEWLDSEADICYKRLRTKGIKVLLRARRIKRNWLAEKARRQEREQLSLLELVG